MPSQNENNFVEFLDSRRGKFVDRKGGWLIGKGVFSHGHDLMGDLLPNKTYFHVLVLNATGNLPDDRFCKWLEAIYICLSWPDPRIWCNTIGSLAGTARASTMTATFAGLIASESKLYGTRTVISGMEFIVSVKRLVDDGVPVDEAIEHLVFKSRGVLHVPGYVRPIADGDDRVKALDGYAQSLGYEVGPHLKVAREVEKSLVNSCGQSMNMNGYAAAFMADLRLTPQQAFSLFPSVVGSGVTACAVEESENLENSFLPLRCSDIEYTGPARRSVLKER